MTRWSDLRAGIAECPRVGRQRVVLLTVDMEFCVRFCLYVSRYELDAS